MIKRRDEPKFEPRPASTGIDISRVINRTKKGEVKTMKKIWLFVLPVFLFGYAGVNAEDKAAPPLINALSTTAVNNTLSRGNTVYTEKVLTATSSSTVKNALSQGNTAYMQNASTGSIESQIQTTYFSFRGKDKKPTGETENNYYLESIGDKVIPVFEVQAETTDGTIIKSMHITGAGITTMVEGVANSNNTAIRQKFKNVSPGTVQISIITNKDPRQIQITIHPSKRDAINQIKSPGVLLRRSDAPSPSDR
jgi:hypothetical protein